MTETSGAIADIQNSFGLFLPFTHINALISVSSPPLPVSPPVPVAVSGSVSPLVQNPEPPERPQEVPDPSDSAMLQSPLLLNDSSPALPSPTIPVIIVEEGSISPIHSTEASLPVGLHTVSDEVQAQANDQIIAQDSDEDIIASAQKILRLRVDAADPITSPSSSAKKAARKKRSKAKSSQSKQKKKKKSSSPGKGKSH